MKHLLFTLLMISSFGMANANPLVSVEVSPTQDRWIHFPDGNKLRHGMEVSHLLNQFLFESGKFKVQLPTSQIVGTNPLISIENPEQKELKQRLPNSKVDYYEYKESQMDLAQNSAQIIIRPRVHTLLYASGKRSNRIVYGFSPDRLNPYNMGVDGISKDNDFTAAQFNEVKQCSNLDFFNGQLKTRGWAHKRGNFGADFDEGISFEIFGFGISFRKKTYAVKLGVEFEVIIPSQGLRKVYDYEFKAEGKDLAIGASYAGIHLGFEKQRRQTMVNAIEESLPKILDEFLADIPKYTWTTKLEQGWDGRWWIPAGVFEGITEGQVFEAANGNRYVVVDAGDTMSAMYFAINNPSPPKEGEELRFVEDLNVSPWDEDLGIRSLASMPVGIQAKAMMGNSFGETTKKKSMSGELENETAPELVERNVGNCAEKRHSWFEKLVMAIMTFYAHWRYDNVYDQEFQAQDVAVKSIGAPKVALISSGVFPREKGIERFIDTSGFDFISWDSRPSDDHGVGTAAAKLLVEETNKDFVIVPVKVFGPHGQTHSSAIYSAMEWVAKRPDIEMVVVPWSPSVGSDAYRDGVNLMINAGKTVVVPKDTNILEAELANKARKKYKTKGIRSAKIQLAPEGVGVIEHAAKIINKGL